jgi:hypothetical protein
MSADELEVEFDPKKVKKDDDDLEVGEVPVVVDPEAEETPDEEDEEGVLEEEINPFGDRWEE